MDREPILLRTERFAIRALTTQDVTERYVGWLNDEETNRFLEVRWQHQTMESVRRYLGAHDNYNSFVLGIFAEPEGRHIGNFSLRLNRNHRSAEMGVMIGDKDYWGRGVVLEARARILDFIFAELPIDKVSGGCYQTNGPAIFNYQRQGWKVDGIRKAEHLDRGRRVDTILFAMFREDWLSRGDR